MNRIEAVREIKKLYQRGKNAEYEGKKFFPKKVFKEFWEENKKTYSSFDKKEKEEKTDIFHNFVESFFKEFFLLNTYFFQLLANTPVDRNEWYAEISGWLDYNDKLRYSGHPDAKYVFMMAAPRGALKTTYVIARKAKSYLYYSVKRRKPPIILLGHGDKDRTEMNLKKIRKVLERPLIEYLYSDVLEKERNARKGLAFKDVGDIARGEDTFLLVSPESDPTGTHITEGMIDDWCSWANCATPEAAKKNASAYYALLDLDDHSGGADIPIYMEIPYTTYWEDCLYSKLEKLPITKVFKRGVIKHGLYQPDKYKYPEDFSFPEILGEMKLKTKFLQQPRYIFRSQQDMISQRRESSLKFDSQLPGYWQLQEEDIALAVITIDPAISKKRKSCDNVTLVSLLDRRGHIFVADGYFTKSLQPSEQIDIALNFAIDYNVNYIIIESVYYQDTLRQAMLDEVNRRGLIISVMPHVHREAKATHYKMFLEPLLNQQRIHVNPKLQELIDQLKGESSSDDGIDCLSFMSEIDINAYCHYDIYNETKIVQEENIVRFRSRKKNRLEEKKNFGVMGM